MNAQELKQKILSFIPQSFGKSYEELKKDILKNCKKNGYGCSDLFTDKKNGYSIFYTENPRFENAKGNGAGFYVRLYLCGYTQSVKID
jgi:hypothetical protein